MKTLKKYKTDERKKINIQEKIIAKSNIDKTVQVKLEGFIHDINTGL